MTGYNPGFKYMKKAIKKAVFVIIGVIVAGILFGGCKAASDNPQGNNTTPNTTQNAQNTGNPKDNSKIAEYNSQLAGLLPSREGYKWRYNGFAEYGHEMTLVSIFRGTAETKYNIQGFVDDMSDGEGNFETGHFGIALTYIIKDGVLRQEKVEKVMMDSESNNIELLRAPLTKGSKWTQDVVAKDGKKLKLDCEITEIKDQNGIKTYTVMYKDKNSEYYEKRQIKEKAGVISFEKNRKDQEGKWYPIGYSIYTEASGYMSRLELDRFLPPLDKLLRFAGLAEYGHEGKMKKVTSDENSAVYQFDGTFTDGSGIPGTFKVQYTFDYVNGTISEKVIDNTKPNAKKNEVNSKISEHIILKFPVNAGTAWQQEVTVNGKKYLMDAKITSVAFRGRTEYSPGLTDHDRQYPVVTVRYIVRDVPGYFNNNYIEERNFQVGRGMIGFSNLMAGDIGISGKDLEDKSKVEEAVLMHMFGYSLNPIEQ